MSDSLNALIAQGGNQPNMLTNFGNVVNTARGYQALQASQYELGQQKLQPAYSALMALRDNPNASWDDVNSALAQAQRIGGNASPLMDEVTARMQRGEKPADVVRAMSLRGVPAFEQAALVTPSVQMLQTPQGLQPVTVGAAGGGHPGVVTPSSGFIPYGLSPHDWAQPVQQWDPKTQTYTSVPFGQAYGYPAPPGLAGTGGGAAAAADDGGAIPAGLPKQEFLQRVAQRESGGNPTALNYVARADPSAYARGATASGRYQIVNNTWNQGAGWAGVDTSQYPTAMSAPADVQDQVASALYDHLGEKPWQKGGQDWVRGPGGQYTLQSVAPGTGGGVVSPPSGPFIGQAISEPAPPGSVTQAPPTPMAPRSLPLPAPGEVQSIETARGVSSQQYAADNAAAGQFQQRMWPLVNAQHILETQGTTTGPGAAAARDIIGHLQTLASVFTPADLQTIGQAKFEELNKYLTQAVNAQPFAQASDARLASAITGNPSAHISTMANQDILKAMIGLERMKQASITDFNNQGLQPMNYANFLRSWQTTHDPRAFVFDMMSQDQRQKMIDGMKSPTERQNFANTLTFVQNNPGLLTRAAMP